jgi:ubiquinone/menaquinone biosynthesis C-methylase UbiE
MGDAFQLYRNAERYDLVARIVSKSEREIAFYLAQARRYTGPALELACGSGRLAIPLAAEQINMTCIDISREMLDLGVKRARQGRHHLAWVESCPED